MPTVQNEGFFMPISIPSASAPLFQGLRKNKAKKEAPPPVTLNEGIQKVQRQAISAALSEASRSSVTGDKLKRLSDITAALQANTQLAQTMGFLDQLKATTSGKQPVSIQHALLALYQQASQLVTDPSHLQHLLTSNESHQRDSYRKLPLPSQVLNQVIALAKVYDVDLPKPKLNTQA